MVLSRCVQQAGYWHSKGIGMYQRSIARRGSFFRKDSLVESRYRSGEFSWGRTRHEKHRRVVKYADDRQIIMKKANRS